MVARVCSRVTAVGVRVLSRLLSVESYDSMSLPSKHEETDISNKQVTLIVIESVRREHGLVWLCHPSPCLMSCSVKSKPSFLSRDIGSQFGFEYRESFKSQCRISIGKHDSKSRTHL